MGVCGGKIRINKTPKAAMIITASSISEAIILDNIQKHYEFIRVLGSGHYGVVREAKRRNLKSKTVAIKTISKTNFDAELEIYRRELDMLRFVDHPNIIKLYEVYEDEKYIHIVTELCTGGDLFDHLVRLPRCTEQHAAKLMNTLMKAVQYLHNHRIAHRDLKPENFLFESTAGGCELKIVDFGLASKFANHVKSMRSMVGSPYYVAPEVLMGTKYGVACDLWSLGVVLHIMLVGYPPFNGENTKDIFIKIERQKLVLDPESWNSVSRTARDLVKRLLVKDPSKRLKISQALIHPWFAKINETQLGSRPSILNCLANLSSFKTPNRFRVEATRIAMQFVTVDNIDRLRQTFRAMDPKNTGQITLENLGLAMKNAGLTLASYELEQIVNSVDYMKNGTIRYTDFLMATVDLKEKLSEQMLFETFKIFDVENTGYISKENLSKAFRQQGISALENEIDVIMDDIEVQEPNKVNFDEFKSMMLADLSEIKSPYPRNFDLFSKSVIETTPISSSKLCAV